jgi:dTDP-4-dehydrorhamnose reductase
MPKIVVTGASGQLGSEIVERANEHGYQIVSLSRNDLDVSKKSEIMDVLHRHEPTHIIHCAAWTAVDDCERNQLKAERINADGTRFTVEAAKELNAHVTYISTDYVFDGKKEEPYEEDDSPSPISAYGLTKLQGETCMRPSDAVIRISSVCGKNGSNIVKTILRIAGESSELSFVDDQFSNPTFADDASLRILELALSNSKGIWHVTNQGSTSWYEFARNVIDFAGMDVPVKPIKYATIRSQRPAPRPMNSVLRNKRMETEGMALLDNHLVPLERLVRHLLS